MKKLTVSSVFIWLLTLEITLAAADPVWQYTMSEKEIVVFVTVPTHEYLYQTDTAPAVIAGGKTLAPAVAPPAVSHPDPVSGQTEMVYPGPGTFSWVFRADKWIFPLKLQVKWRGCSEGDKDQPATCFLPGSGETVFRSFSAAARPEQLVFTSEASEDGRDAGIKDTPEASSFPAFDILRTESGYLGAPEFIRFLKGEKRDLFLSFTGKSFLVIMLLTFLGGIALNLTPCVLPMIPVNLAIIGAKTGSRASCVLRGVIYGGGIALAYGILGVLAVLTGAGFGSVDSTWWFNTLVALLFIALGLSLFDLFTLDFSRYGGGFTGFAKAKYAGIFLMGAVTALLAGACVAPVVVAALLQAGKMYNEGRHVAGLCLPFVLGLGMALPWPLAAGGFSVMPKPGAWMRYVKYVFGVIIIGLGLYYGWTAFKIGASHASSPENIAQSRARLINALRESGAGGKPVLLDFRADWCKNCLAMEKTTFRDPAVKAELNNFIFLPFDATAVSNPEIRAVLKKFKVAGLPAYLVVRGK